MLQFGFLEGKYRHYDMSGLDLRLVRDWAMFTALSSAGQGLNREAAWSSFLNKTEEAVKEYLPIPLPIEPEDKTAGGVLPVLQILCPIL